MSRRTRPAARKKTLYNVKCSQLSETDKKCIEEVFGKFEQQKTEIEALTEKLNGAIAGQETLQKYLAEKNEEIKKLKSRVNSLKNYDEKRDISLHARLIMQARTEGMKELAERLKTISRKSYRYDYKLNETIVRGIIYDDEIDDVLKELEGKQ